MSATMTRREKTVANYLYGKFVRYGLIFRGPAQAGFFGRDGDDYAVMLARTRAAMNGNTPAEVQRHVDKYPVIHTRMNARQAG